MSDAFWYELNRGAGIYTIVARVMRQAQNQYEAVTILRNGTRILKACTSMYETHWQERYMDGGAGLAG